MEALNQKNGSLLEPVITDFSRAKKGIKFRKELLVDELLSLGVRKITRQIAELVAGDVEKEIHRRRIQFLSSELISEMVAAKLEGLGLIRPGRSQGFSSHPLNNSQKISPPAKDVLSEELLEVLSPSAQVLRQGGPLIVPERPRKVGLEWNPESLEKLSREFCLKNAQGEAIETPEETLSRVARAVAEGDSRYDPMAKLDELECTFYNLLARREFFPEMSTLKYAGVGLGQLTGSFVLPVLDTTESIFDAMKQAAVIRKRGGASGFSFSFLRPRHDWVASARRPSSGPVAFMKVFCTALDAFVAGAALGEKDRGILNIDHPDIMDFLSFKNASLREGGIRLSVGISDSFMEGVADDQSYWLTNPRTGEKTEKIKARQVFRALVEKIATSGEPSVLFLDALARGNPTPQEGRLLAVTAGGNQPLLPYETAALGAVNLECVVKNGEIRWSELQKIVCSAVHFLENVIEITHYPLTDCATLTRKNRKIGVGVMGWAGLLEKMGLPYAGEEAHNLAEKLASFLQKEAEGASSFLANKRGAFAGFDESRFSGLGLKRRHATVTAFFDTEGISRLASCSTGIEPTRPEGLVLEDHLKIQAAFERHAELGVFKKIPLPGSLSAQSHIATAFVMGHRLGLRTLAFTLARDTSPSEKNGLEKEIISNFIVQEEIDSPSTHSTTDPYFVPGEPEDWSMSHCAQCGAPLVLREGLLVCPACKPEISA